MKRICFLPAEGSLNGMPSRPNVFICSAQPVPSNLFRI